MKASKGIAFFAYNTEQIDYLKLAVIAATYAKKYMPEFKVCLITDSASWDWFKTTDAGCHIDTTFDDVILYAASTKQNKRAHHDSPWTKFMSDFKNGNKHKILDITPYDQTMLVDIDYIIQNNILEQVFNTDAAISLFHEAEQLDRSLPSKPERLLHDSGIPMLWSTVVYFDKHKESTKLFFDIWAHVADNYEFYTFLYGFPGHMFRTDYCVSIANHIMNGMGNGNAISSLPGKLINMSQMDDVVKVNNMTEWSFLLNDKKENWKDTLLLTQNESIHVMNKRALERMYAEIMKQANV